MLYIKNENESKNMNEKVKTLLEYYISDIDYILELDSECEEYYRELREYVNELKEELWKRNSEEERDHSLSLYTW